MSKKSGESSSGLPGTGREPLALRQFTSGHVREDLETELVQALYCLHELIEKKASPTELAGAKRLVMTIEAKIRMLRHGY